MALDRDLLALMPRTVTVAAPSGGLSAAGVPTFSTGSTTLRARVTPVAEQVIDDRGVERTSSHVAWLASTSSTGPPAALSAAWKFTSSVLPSGVVPLRVERPDDEEGRHHVKVWFGP